MPQSSVADRFWAKVDASGICWEWTASRRYGYGVAWDGARTCQAHRFAWEMLVGEIPQGLVLDHLCKNKACVNPDHLEPVTQAENLRRNAAGVAAQRNRKTHCANGHAFDEENTYRRRGTHRCCRTCARARQHKYDAKQHTA